ncbi:hypothetical protein C4K37_4526 [Pseudomonas chlororaphis subsp. piscium]|nr:hypothetical protein C4K37_4526 [Pseudomonas chlororaphis subsp. piscium]AZC45449.1 hypothetical protein C4K36_4538 [Pseudomonas chlororaphis subsp. piscium]
MTVKVIAAPAIMADRYFGVFMDMELFEASHYQAPETPKRH